MDANINDINNSIDTDFLLDVNQDLSLNRIQLLVAVRNVSVTPIVIMDSFVITKNVLKNLILATHLPVVQEPTAW